MFNLKPTPWDSRLVSTSTPGAVHERDLAAAVFALHPSAAERVLLQLGYVAGRRVVVMMDVPTTDPARSGDPVPDRDAQTARITELVAELAAKVPNAGNELTVMRDRPAALLGR